MASAVCIGLIRNRPTIGLCSIPVSHDGACNDAEFDRPAAVTVDIFSDYIALTVTYILATDVTDARCEISQVNSWPQLNHMIYASVYCIQ